MRLRTATLAAALAGMGLHCRPGPLDETGKRCSEERGCGEGYRCAAGVCLRETSGADGGVPDAGPPDAGPRMNLVVNGGFESGQASLQGWEVSGGTAQLFPETGTPETGEVRTEKRAGKVTAFAEATLMLAPTTPPVASSAVAQVYCAAAWVRGSGRPLRLRVREGAPPQILESDGLPVTTEPLVFKELRAVHTAQGGQPLSVQVVLPDATLGDSFIVDDVQLWPSQSVSCPEW